MQLVLTCPSGIAGNLWMAALLELGADAAVLDALPVEHGGADLCLARPPLAPLSCAPSGSPPSTRARGA